MLTMLARNVLRQTASSARSFSTSRPTNLSKLTLIGRLGAVPTVAKDKQGREILIYSVATSDRVGAPGADGSRQDPATTWHRVLHYNTTDASRQYLGSLPSGTMVHIEADFKKRVIKDDAGNYSDQTLNLLKNIEVLSKPPKAEGSSTEAESEAQGN